MNWRVYNVTTIYLMVIKIYLSKMNDLENVLSMTWEDQVLSLANSGADEHFIRALICTRPESDWYSLLGDAPQVVYSAIDTLKWEKRISSSFYEVPTQPKYRPVNELLSDFNGVGKKQAARKELQKRLPYLSSIEQKQVIYTFLDTEIKTDRLFVLKFLYKHYDSQYLEAIKTVWELFHDFESAKVLTRFAPLDFVTENFERLVTDYRYLPVRLRMPADFPMDRSLLEMHELMYLCARQGLEISETEAFACLSNTIHRQIEKDGFYYEGSCLLKLTYVNSILWSLGVLGFQNIILRFYIENEKTKGLFSSGLRCDVSQDIKSILYEDGFLVFDNFLGTKDSY